MKGDWPALVKLGQITRHHGREAKDSVGICHLCAAGQTNFDFNLFGYNDLVASRTDDLPWDTPSPLTATIPQDRTKLPMFYKVDIFHTCHKGVMADLCANAIVTLFDLNVDGMSVNSGIDKIYEEVVAHAQKHKLSLHMLQLSRTLLGFANSWSFPAGWLCSTHYFQTLKGFVLSRQFSWGIQAQSESWKASRLVKLGVINARSWFKGADTTTLTHFLEKRYADLVSDKPNHPHCRYLTSILAGLQASNVFFHTLYAAPLWLRNKDRDTLIDSLYGVLRSFAEAANYAYGVLKKTRFKYQPKYHMLAEIRFAMMVDRNNLVPSLNPLAFSTQMDEDYVGKICQMSRFVASRTVRIKTIERLKLALMALW